MTTLEKIIRRIEELKASLRGTMDDEKVEEILRLEDAKAHLEGRK